MPRLSLVFIEQELSHLRTVETLLINDALPFRESANGELELKVLLISSCSLHYHHHKNKYTIRRKERTSFMRAALHHDRIYLLIQQSKNQTTIGQPYDSYADYE
jgi:hypothetical protein